MCVLSEAGLCTHVTSRDLGMTEDTDADAGRAAPGPKVTLGPNPGLSANIVQAQANLVKVWESGQNRREGREMKWATRTGHPEVGGHIWYSGDERMKTRIPASAPVHHTVSGGRQEGWV